MAHTLQGIVSSAQRDKTITVSIASRETHPLYRKQYTKTRKYTAHDETNQAGVGDKVEIAACRPYSKTKAYVLVKILEKSHGTVKLKEDVIPGVEPAQPANQSAVASSEAAAAADSVDSDSASAAVSASPATAPAAAVADAAETKGASQ